MSYYLGVDIGGTKTAIGIVTASYSLLDKVLVPTPKSPSVKEIGDLIAVTAQALLAKHKLSFSDIISGGAGCPGTVDMKTGHIIFACNLDMHNAPLAEYLSKKMEIPFFICNDADAAAFGEYIVGAGSDVSSAITVTLGTGVGTGIIMNDKIIPSEGGHIVTKHGGIQCNCGRKGCFEKYASATALIEQAIEAMENNKNSLLWELSGGTENVNGKILFEAIDLGDKTAQEVLDKYVEYVAGGLTSIINLLLPEMICIGGGVSAQGERLIAPIRKLVHAEQFTLADGSYTQIVACTLGNDAGIIGAATFSKYI